MSPLALAKEIVHFLLDESLVIDIFFFDTSNGCREIIYQSSNENLVINYPFVMKENYGIKIL